MLSMWVWVWHMGARCGVVYADGECSTLDAALEVGVRFFLSVVLFCLSFINGSVGLFFH